MLCCDLAICADDVIIGDQHTNRDLMPGAGGIPRPIRRISWQRAMYLLSSGHWLSGVEASKLGWVLKSVLSQALDHEVETMCREVLQRIKRAALAGRDVPLATAIDEATRELLHFLTSSKSAVQGIARFMARCAVKSTH